MRGAFLRVALALRAAKADDPSLPELRRRARNLRPQVSAAWLAGAFRAFAEDDVREAVFRNLLGEKHWGPSFLQVEGGADPSWYLFDRLRADYWNEVFGFGVKPRSALGQARISSGVWHPDTA